MTNVGRMLVSLCAAVVIATTLAAQSKPKSRSNLITQEEIQRAGASVGNAFQAVELLRPRWLKAREMLLLPSGASDPQMSEIHVYVDERDRGDLEYLKTIPAELIYTLQYMSTNEVGARFGPSSGPGIVVTLKH
jgi:hypothetical protein